MKLLQQELPKAVSLSHTSRKCIYFFKSSSSLLTVTCTVSNPLVPSSPPMNLSLVRSDSWFIVVEWKPVPWGCENGVIKGYRLVYSVKDAGNSMSMTDESIYSENTAVLSGLEFATLYSIRVAAFTSVGSGNFSESIEVRTKRCKLTSSIPSARPKINSRSHGLKLQRRGCAPVDSLRYAEGWIDDKSQRPVGSLAHR